MPEVQTNQNPLTESSGLCYLFNAKTQAQLGLRLTAQLAKVA